MGTSALFSLGNPLRKRKEKQTHLLGCDDFRAENAREEHAHTHIRAYEFSGAFRSRRGRCVCASDHKTRSYFLLFWVYFLKGDTCSLQKSARMYTMTERKSSRKTLTPKRFIPEETEKKDKDVSGGQKSGGSKVRLIS